MHKSIVLCSEMLWDEATNPYLPNRCPVYHLYRHGNLHHSHCYPSLGWVDEVAIKVCPYSTVSGLELVTQWSSSSRTRWTLRESSAEVLAETPLTISNESFGLLVSRFESDPGQPCESCPFSSEICMMSRLHKTSPRSLLCDRWVPELASLRKGS